MKKGFFTEQELSASFDAGSLSFVPYLVLENTGKVTGNYTREWYPDGANAHWYAEYKEGFRDDLYFTFSNGDLTCRRLIRNVSGKKIALTEAGFSISGIKNGNDPEQDFYYHAENSRVYAAMTLPIEFDRLAPGGKDPKYPNLNTWLSYVETPVCTKRVGATPYQPFPAILIGNHESTHGLVHGTLEQRVFYHCYDLAHENGTVRMDVVSGFKGIDALEVVPGRTLVDRWYLGTTDHADDIEKIFERYTEVLRSVLPPMYGASDANRHYGVWESWNDGNERRVNEEMLLAEAEFVSKHFPTVKYFQLDDGYWHRDDGALGLGTAYEKDGGIDRKKFPEGLRAYSDKVRKHGLIPAIWTGYNFVHDSQVALEHPEWRAPYAWRYEVDYPGLKAGLVADPSIPEVRDYLAYAINTFCSDYNFNGIKLDFWSYVFDTSYPMMKYREHSGYEWRRWLLTEFRKNLPTDGYFQPGCDIVQANPFLGEFFTNYRYGLDISGGEWDHVKITFLWGTSCFATHIGDIYVPNSDSIGIPPGLNETERYFAVNYTLISRSMVELSGKLHSDCPPHWLKVLKKAFCNLNNGQDVHFARYDYRKKNAPAPSIWFIDTPHFSRNSHEDTLPVKTVALFNLEERENTISVSPADLKLPAGNYILTDVWTGKQYPFSGEVTMELPLHGSMLLAVSKTEGLQLFDANIRLEKTGETANSILFAADYEADAELLLNRKPEKILWNGTDLEFTFNSGLVTFHLPEKGTLELVF